MPKLKSEYQRPPHLPAKENCYYCKTDLIDVDRVMKCDSCDTSWAMDDTGHRYYPLKVNGRHIQTIESVMELSDDGLESEESFQMLWDCKSCGKEKLLGVDHRFCPSCGGAQDPSSRYFPEDGDEISIANHEYTGADWMCDFCETPNSDKANRCVGCGAGKDGSSPVDLINTPQPTIIDKSPTEKTNKGYLKYIIGFLILAIVSLILVFNFSTKDETVTVDGFEWKRTIQIERFQAIYDSSFCDQLPFDHYRTISKKSKVYKTEKVLDGETCKQVKVDKGDGSFKKKKKCTDKFKTKKLSKDFCRFQAHRWVAHRKVEEKGIDQEPKWPLVNLPKPTLFKGRLGSEREASNRSETYNVFLKTPEKSTTCSLDELKWKALKMGQKVLVKVKKMTGNVSCGSIP